MRGLEYKLWMCCLFLKFEDRDCLPGERELEVQEGPGVGAVQKTTKQCRSHVEVVRAEMLNLSQHRGEEKPVLQLDGRLLDNDRRAFLAPAGCK